ncbi:MAG TPA: hypothetical protein VIK77_00265 [Tissierellaceae bacterium]
MIKHPYLEDRKVVVEAAPAGDKFNGLLTSDSARVKRDKPFLYLGFNNQRGFDVPVSVINRGLVTIKGEVIMDNKTKHPCPDILDDKGNPMELTELEYFEKVLNRDLNPYLPVEKNFWRSGDKNLKNVSIIEGRLELDLKNPLDRLKYKILIANEDVVAKSKEVADKFQTGKWEFIIRDSKAIENDAAEEALLEAEAYEHFNKIKHSKEDMIKVLSVIYNKEVRPETDIKAITSEVYTSMKKDLKVFIDGMNDKNFDTKYFIRRLLVHKLIKYDYKYLKYSIDDEPIGNLNDTINYFNNPVNSETIVELKSRLAMAEK